MEAPARPAVLRGGGTCLVLDVAGPLLPRVLHWGADLDPADESAVLLAATPAVPNGGLDGPMAVALLPAQAGGWTGRPGIAGHREGAWPHLRLELTQPVRVDPSALVADAADPSAGVEVRCELSLEPQGVLRMRHTVRNVGSGAWSLDEMLCLLPVPATAGELLDTTGHWARERSPQRGPLPYGVSAREVRRGRTGHDAPGLLVAGTPGFGFEHGQVWGVHIGWSGNHIHLAQRQVEGVTLLGGGELLMPGEIRLAPGQSYRTPWAYFAFSDRGLNGLSAGLHQWLRARDNHPRSPRPVVLNTWEAVYFDHRLDRLTALADRAARIGVERFVLDDGWFTGRRDDTAGLGDWQVDPAVWPDGLHPLVKHVRAAGMQFGLWVEPEMVNPNSDLARAHPDWLLAAPGRPAPPARHQQVLDLARPEVFAYLLELLDQLVTEYELDFLKWDHNRDLLEAVHVHRQTRAAYRLMDWLRQRHPGLEIESCAGGGGRVDLGILAQTDRIWTSDNNDPLERQRIQRWTGLLLPPELIGCHVGPPAAHTTGRTASLRFRCATALFGHAGLEWDLTECGEEEFGQLAAWIRGYQRVRCLLHSGTLVHADHPDPAAWLYGAVSPDRRHALFAYVQMDSSADLVPARLRFPGLAPELAYTVSVWPGLGPAPSPARRPPAWIEAGGVTLTGATLSRYGLAAPILNPADAMVLEMRVR